MELQGGTGEKLGNAMSHDTVHNCFAEISFLSNSII